jgi:hypothetical protein
MQSGFVYPYHFEAMPGARWRVTVSTECHLTSLEDKGQSGIPYVADKETSDNYRPLNISSIVCSAYVLCLC